MASSSSFPPSSTSLSAPSSSQPTPLHLRLKLPSQPPGLSLLPFSRALQLPLRLSIPRPILPHAVVTSLSGGGDDDVVFDDNNNNNSGGDEGHNNNSGGGGGDDEPNRGGDGSAPDDDHRGEALFVLAQLGRKLESLPADLAAAVENGRVTGEIVRRFNDLEANALFRWLLQFPGFRERLLADDLFLSKIAIEVGIGVLAKLGAEFQKRGEDIVNEIDFVISDVIMAIIADIMLVYIPAPTVSFQPPLARNAGAIASFFHNCPDNAFQIALGGRSFSLVQRLGAIVSPLFICKSFFYQLTAVASLQRNGAKLAGVGAGASLIGTSFSSVLIKARRAFDKGSEDKGEEIPVLATSLGYGTYMAISSNLRYQIVAGVLEQRMLEPLLHNHKVLLSAVCTVIRTGNTFLGALLWIDFARLVGIQKAHEHEEA
ncbi:hypothetical protein HU200_067382 [Digitaria exilis]|uniref:Uncharacterized protein n=1 Tax=Digitaria exilis TaxID=1010633 RepID=A0A834ZZH1_9POAL|nr:hypothetical protein HU200_067382 [Digitaria exilis]